MWNQIKPCSLCHQCSRRTGLHRILIVMGAILLVGSSLGFEKMPFSMSFLEDTMPFEATPLDTVNKNHSSQHEYVSNQTTPATMVEPAKNKSIHVSLVMTYCSGDLRWLKNYTHDFPFDYTYVGVKCGIEPDRNALPDGAELVRLPNVGGCDHTMAYWMSEVLPTLPRTRETPGGEDKEEVVLFLKDSIIQRNFTVQQDFHTLLDLALSDQSFGCLYQYHPDSRFRFYRNTYKVRKFRMQWYIRDGGVRKGVVGHDVPFKSPFYTSLRAWQNAMQVKMPQPMVPMCYGGMFTVKRSRIEHVPLSVWSNITHSLSRGNNIEEGHYAERTWAALLMDKDYIKNATIGMESS